MLRCLGCQTFIQLLKTFNVHWASTGLTWLPRGHQEAFETLEHVHKSLHEVVQRPQEAAQLVWRIQKNRCQNTIKSFTRTRKHKETYFAENIETPSYFLLIHQKNLIGPDMLRKIAVKARTRPGNVLEHSRPRPVNFPDVSRRVGRSVSIVCFIGCKLKCKELLVVNLWSQLKGLIWFAYLCSNM